jgi:hypothetical protein
MAGQDPALRVPRLCWDDSRWYLSRCGTCLILGFVARWVYRPLHRFSQTRSLPRTGPVFPDSSRGSPKARGPVPRPRSPLLCRTRALAGSGGGVFVVGGAPPPAAAESHPPSAPSPLAEGRRLSRFTAAEVFERVLAEGRRLLRFADVVTFESLLPREDGGRRCRRRMRGSCRRMRNAE